MSHGATSTGVTLREYLEPRAGFAREGVLRRRPPGGGQAWSAVHEHGIIHRDLKASNIMVDRRGVVRLMDFGIAREVERQGPGYTASGHVLGTPEYMSPEQVPGKPVDFRSDVYSLGCVVYEIFTGRAPFVGTTAAATFHKQLHEAPALDAARDHLPEPLVPVLATALAKEPAERFTSASAFRAALEQARTADHRRAEAAIADIFARREDREGGDCEGGGARAGSGRRGSGRPFPRTPTPSPGRSSPPSRAPSSPARCAPSSSGSPSSSWPPSSRRRSS